MALDVHIKRDKEETWGFKLIGGADFNMPLTVVKVLQNSPAERAGLQNGDTVSRIDNKEASTMYHDDANKAVADAKDDLILGVTHGLYDPVLDEYEPIYEPIDQGDFDQPSQPSEVQFQIQQFLDPNQDIISETPLTESRSLTASPFVQPTKPYRPFSTDPIDVPPLEDPIILNPNYNDEFGKYDNEELPETRFKLPISPQYDPEGKKNKQEISEKQETEIKIESKVENQDMKMTKEEVRQEIEFMEKMRQEIDLEKIETTATSIVAESIDKAMTVAQEINKEIDVELKESSVHSDISKMKTESKSFKEMKVSSEISTDLIKKESVKESRENVEEIIVKDESKEIKINKEEKLERIEKQDREKKASTRNESEETIVDGVKKSVTATKQSEIRNLKEDLKEEVATKETRVKDARGKDESQKLIHEAQNTQKFKEHKVSGDSQKNTSRLLSEQRAYTIGLQTIPNIRGSVHSSYHYNLLLKTFFIHLTDVMVALSRFILNEPVFSETLNKDETKNEKTMSVDERTTMEYADKAVVETMKEEAEYRNKSVQEAKNLQEDVKQTLSVKAEEVTVKRKLSGAEMAQRTERKSEELTQKMGTVISEFQNKAVLEEAETSNLTLRRDRRSRSRSQMEEEIIKAGDPLNWLAKSDRQKQSQETTEIKEASSEFSSKMSESKHTKQIESKHFTKELRTPTPKDKNTYIAIVESHVYTNKDYMFDEIAEMSETASIQSAEDTNISLESREVISTEQLALDNSEMKKNVEAIKKHEEIEQISQQIVDEVQQLSIDEVSTEQASTTETLHKVAVQEIIEPIIETTEVEVLKSEFGEVKTSVETGEYVSVAAVTDTAIEEKSSVSVKEEAFSKTEAVSAKSSHINDESLAIAALTETSIKEQSTVAIKDEAIIQSKLSSAKSFLVEKQTIAIGAVTEKAVEEHSAIKEKNITKLDYSTVKPSLIEKESVAIAAVTESAIEEEASIDIKEEVQTKLDYSTAKSSLIEKEAVAVAAVTEKAVEEQSAVDIKAEAIMKLDYSTAQSSLIEKETIAIAAVTENVAVEQSAIEIKEENITKLDYITAESSLIEKDSVAIAAITETAIEEQSITDIKGESLTKLDYSTAKSSLIDTETDAVAAVTEKAVEEQSAVEIKEKSLTKLDYSTAKSSLTETESVAVAAVTEERVEEQSAIEIKEKSLTKLDYSTAKSSLTETETVAVGAVTEETVEEQSAVEIKGNSLTKLDYSTAKSFLTDKQTVAVAAVTEKAVEEQFAVENKGNSLIKLDYSTAKSSLTETETVAVAAVTEKAVDEKFAVEIKGNYLTKLDYSTAKSSLTETETVAVAAVTEKAVKEQSAVEIKEKSLTKLDYSTAESSLIEKSVAIAAVTETGIEEQLVTATNEEAITKTEINTAQISLVENESISTAQVKEAKVEQSEIIIIEDTLEDNKVTDIVPEEYATVIVKPVKDESAELKIIKEKVIEVEVEAINLSEESELYINEQLKTEIGKQLQQSEAYKSMRSNLTLDLTQLKMERQDSVQSDENNNIKTPTPSTIPPTPVTDEYIFKLAIPLPKSRDTTPVPRDPSPEPSSEHDEDPHIVKKKLIPHIDTTIESVIYDPPLPSPPESKIGSPVYTKPGLKGGAIVRNVFKEEILEIGRKSSLLASAIDKTIKSIEEYKEEVGMDTKKENERATMEVTRSKSVQDDPLEVTNKHIMYNGFSKVVKTKVYDSQEVKDEKISKEWSEIEAQITNNNETLDKLADSKTVSIESKKVLKIDTKLEQSETIVENNVIQNGNGSAEAKVAALQIEKEPQVVNKVKLAETKSIEMQPKDSTIANTNGTQNDVRVEAIVTQVKDLNGNVKTNVNIVEEKPDPLQFIRPVHFNPNEIPKVGRQVVINIIPNEVPKPEVYTTETGEILGTIQGIVDGLEDAVVDEEVAKELGKPGMTEDKIAELISGESEMLREAHVMGLSRVISAHMHRATDDSSVDFKKIKPIIESLKDSEVLKALNDELIKTTEEKKKEERKWTKFLQKPKRPVPRPKFGYHGWTPTEEEIEEPYKVKIVKQPKPKVAPDYKPEDFDTGPLPWEERALNQTPPPNDEPEEPILVPEEVPEFLEAVDPLPESEVPDLEDTGIPLPEKIEEVTKEIEPVEEEKQEVIEEPIEEIKADIKEEIVKTEEMEQNMIAEQLLKNVQSMVDPNATVEEQLAQMRAQIAALSQLPLVIQKSLEMVTKQLSQITQQESHQNQSQQDQNQQDDSLEESQPNNAEEAQVENNEATQNQNAEEQPQTNEQNDQVTVQEMTEAPVENKPSLTAEEMERLKREEEEMLEEQRRIEKQKKEMMEQMKLEQESRQVKQRSTPRVGKPKPVFGPLNPEDRPLILPGGRKWRNPQDVYNEQLFAETLAAQAELIQGKVKGINFMKYEKPPVSLDHLQHSDVYKMVHNMEPPMRRVELLTPTISEADYRERCRSITPGHMDIPQQVQP